MTEKLIARIREHRSGTPERARIAERMLELLDCIQQLPAGAERERLLKLAVAAFDRFEEIGELACRARTTLKALSADQARLAQLLDFVLAREEENRVLH